MTAVSGRTDNAERGPQRKPKAAWHPRELARAKAQRWNAATPFTPPPRSEWPVALKRVRTVGLTLFGVQLVVLLIWTAVLVHRRAVTWDFAVYQQAAWLIGHGHLNPYSTLLHRPFFLNDGELLIWPLAVLLRIWPNFALFPWLQDLALVGGELVVLQWMCELAAREAKQSGAKSGSVAVAGLGVLLLFANPWLAWTASFDFHLEPFLTLFILCAARDLYRGRNRGWLWLAMAMLCGTVGGSYLLVFGVSMMLCGRWCLRRGAIAAGLGALVMLTLTALNAHPEQILDLFAPVVTGNASIPFRGVTGTMLIKSIFEHPLRVISLIWQHRANIWGELSPGGVLGVLWLPFTLPILFVVAEGGLGLGALLGFETPGFQNVALVTMVALGTVAICLKLAGWSARGGRRRKQVLAAVIVLLAANSVAWAIVWLPDVERNWLVVSPSAASTIRTLERKIGPHDQVLVSQGISGTFARRVQVNVITGATIAVHIRARQMWVVFAPQEGVEYDDSAGIFNDISELEQRPDVREVVAANGIWAFEVTTPHPHGIFRLSPTNISYAPGWVIPGQTARPVLSGPETSWYAASTNKPGYVVDHSYWQSLPGVYRASVVMSVSGHTHANFEVWDSTSSTLLARSVITHTHGPKRFTLKVRLRHVQGQPALSGFGPWSVLPQRVPTDNIEVRVWSPGTGRVAVYQAAVNQLSGQRYDLITNLPLGPGGGGG